MPYEVGREGDKWVVKNTDTGEVKARHDTEEEAQRQVRLLRMIEHGGTPR